jgi:hypothetical protein
VVWLQWSRNEQTLGGTWYHGMLERTVKKTLNCYQNGNSLPISWGPGLSVTNVVGAIPPPHILEVEVNGVNFSQHKGEVEWASNHQLPWRQRKLAPPPAPGPVADLGGVLRVRRNPTLELTNNKLTTNTYQACSLHSISAPPPSECSPARAR